MRDRGFGLRSGMALTEEEWGHLESVTGQPRHVLELVARTIDSVPAATLPARTRDGREIAPGEAFLLGMDDDYKRVALTVVCGLEVSTVWIGWMTVRGLFETIVFDHHGERLEGPFRHECEAEALAAHERIVAECAARLN